MYRDTDSGPIFRSKTQWDCVIEAIEYAYDYSIFKPRLKVEKQKKWWQFWRAESFGADFSLEDGQEIPNLTIYGDLYKKGAVISFNINNIHAHDIAHILDGYGISIRAGHHCAQPIMRRLNISSPNRVSFYIYNTFSEIDSLVDSLNKTIQVFN